MINFNVEPGYYDLTPEQKAQICNGAGAANDWRSAFIPNKILGLDCTEVFNIHDYAYHVGRTDADKDRADMNMLINLLRLIKGKGNRWARWWANSIAIDYYYAVAEFGRDAFYAGKS
ncbi:MAG: hypothetical protein ACXV8W_14940 [Methylobacter sp.]